MSTDPTIMAGEINELNDMLSQRDTRIRQLEHLNATLAAEIDRMRPVVEAAQMLMQANNSYDIGRANARICVTVNDYQASQPK